MRENLQTMILPVIGALIGGQIAVTRTGKLRKDIRENINLLGQLPTDHPSRVRLEGNIGELVDTLVHRQQRRYGPFTHGHRGHPPGPRQSPEMAVPSCTPSHAC
jgi:hypothetical protein